MRTPPTSAADLELYMLCLKVLGKIPFHGLDGKPHINQNGHLEIWEGGSMGDPVDFDPLHNDAQAMAMVKRFRMSVGCSSNGMWFASSGNEVPISRNPVAFSPDLNRAIVECVAKMQAAKVTA